MTIQELGIEMEQIQQFLQILQKYDVVLPNEPISSLTLKQ